MDEDILAKKRNKAKRDGNVQVLVDVEKKLGDLYYDKKHYEDALQAYKGQLHAAEALNDQLNCAVAHRMIGEVYADIGDFDEALKHQNLYLKIAKEIENLIEEQRAFATLGRTYLLVADNLLKESENDKKKEMLKEAKKAFSKSILLCHKLENKIDLTELIMMRARLLLNLGLVLEQQDDAQQGLNLIQQAASLCKKNNLHEDLHRVNIALAGISDRLGQSDLALKYLVEATKVEDPNLRADAKLLKAELLLKLGEWVEAKKILHPMYKSKRLIEETKQQVTKLLRIAVFLIQSEDKLLTTDDLSIKEKIYEKMGDAAVFVRALDKAEHYYRKMLSCAEKTNSSQLGVALISLSETLKDAGKFEEAIPYARRELELCPNSKEAFNSALYLASLMIEAKSPDEEILEMYNKAEAAAKECNDARLERTLTKDLIDYLQKQNPNSERIESLTEKLESLPNSEPEEEERETPDIGAEICLDELSDDEEEVRKVPKATVSVSTRRPRYVLKKNEKGETPLHVACIKGNISTVEKLLAEQHPTAVRDHCGWTPLHEASNHGYVEIVKLLVNAKADVNDPGGARCDGVTPLHDAAANGHAAVVNLLLDSGADPNLLTKRGDSALDCLEEWRKRVNQLSVAETLEYDHLRRRLRSMITINNKKKKKKDKEAGEGKWDALIDDEDEEQNCRIGNTIETFAQPERISAGEDYKRTIASMQHPGRLNLPTKQLALPKITAPLLDSEEILADDWLEDDMNSNGKRSSNSTKRKSKNDDSDPDIERDVDKSAKRQKTSAASSKQTTHLEKASSSVFPMEIEDSCDSNDSELGREIESWPKPKKSRQLNLLKQGFTRNVPSRSPSPTKSTSPDFSVIRDSGCVVIDNLDLEIRVDDEFFELKLHFRDMRKSMSDIEELIRHKFEIKTGCRPKMLFKTLDDVVLAPEVIIDEVPRDKNKLQLLGEITENNVPSIVDRYKKVCESFAIDATDSMLKSLRSCDNTSTFKWNANESTKEELEPLVKCLRYQQNLQILNLSSANFFSSPLLNYAICHLEKLCELHLQCCDIDFECISKIDKLPLQTRVLDLSYNPLGSKSQEKLYDLLKPLKHLQTLNLKCCELNDFKYKWSSSSLVNLDISWNPIGGEGATNLLQRQLLNLSLSNTQNFKQQRLNVIDTIFFRDSLQFSLFTLESLELSFCDVTDLDVEKILSKTPNLTRIILSNNLNITRTSLCAILARKPTMTYIDISSCRIIDQAPDSSLRIVTPQVCTLLVHMEHDQIDAWEALWQGKGFSKWLPHKLVLIKPN